MRFVSSYRDALFAAGWKLIDVTKLDEQSTAPETVTVSAHYMSNGRNIYARVTQEPDGPYEINVADVGAENWAAMLAKDCRVRIPSLHFDLDRPTLQRVRVGADAREARGSAEGEERAGGRDPGSHGQHRPGRRGGAADVVGRPREGRRRVAHRARRAGQQGHVEGLRKNAADRRKRQRSGPRDEPADRSRRTSAVRH